MRELRVTNAAVGEPMQVRTTQTNRCHPNEGLARARGRPKLIGDPNISHTVKPSHPHGRLTAHRFPTAKPRQRGATPQMLGGTAPATRPKTPVAIPARSSVPLRLHIDLDPRPKLPAPSCTSGAGCLGPGLIRSWRSCVAATQGISPTLGRAGEDVSPPATRLVCGPFRRQPWSPSPRAHSLTGGHALASLSFAEATSSARLPRHWDASRASAGAAHRVRPATPGPLMPRRDPRGLGRRRPEGPGLFRSRSPPATRSWLAALVARTHTEAAFAGLSAGATTPIGCACQDAVDKAQVRCTCRRWPFVFQDRRVAREPTEITQSVT